MTLQKTVNVNSVKNASKICSSQSEVSPNDPKPKSASLQRKQNKRLSQNDETLMKNTSRAGFRVIK